LGNLLITGASGFLGGFLIPAALDGGWHVHGLDLIEPVISHKNYHHFTGSLSYICKTSLDELNFDGSDLTIIHLAGISDAEVCQENPQLAFEINVNLTKTVIDLGQRIRCRRFIFPSSALVYGFRSNLAPIDESQSTRPDSIYGWTKYLAEQLVINSIMAHGTEACILRLSNLLAFPAKPNTVMFDVISQLKAGNKVVKIRDGNPVRDFICVEDVVNAVLATCECKLTEQVSVFNVGSGIKTSIKEFSELICKFWDGGSAIVSSTAEETIDPSGIVIDNSRLRRIGWHLKFPVDQCIKQICDNY